MILKDNRAPSIPPCGSNLAAIYAIIDLGSQPDTYGVAGDTKHQIEIGFRILVPNCHDIFEIKATFTQSLNEKATLSRVVEAVLGRPLTVQDRRGFDAKDLLGKPLIVYIAHKVSVRTNKSYGKIMDYASAPMGAVIPDLSEEFMICGLTPGEFDQKVFDRLPPWTQEKIVGSPEFEKLLTLGSKPAVAVLPPPKRTAAEIIDDELPF